jgi:Zn-dependent protease/CBS domain-containing protein
MGVFGALGLFASVILHELSHSLVARRYGMPMKGITLFIFGGVSEMGSEPPSAKAEFWMAIAGPVSSVVLGGIFYSVTGAARLAGASTAFTATFGWLGMINLVLAAFNLIPGFPLDGGRVLRSALWYWRKDLRWATRIASQIGGGFGMMLVILGVLSFVSGDAMGGIWYLLIGLFLRMAAKQSYQQIVLREALSGETVERFMNPTPVTVRPDLPVRRLVEDYMYRQHYRMYPVTESDGTLLGYVSAQQIKDVQSERWDTYTVGDILEPARSENTISPQADAMEALERMTRSGITRLLVVEGSRLAGIITLKDLLKLLSLRMELGDHAPADRQRASDLRMNEPAQWRAPAQQHRP